MSAVRLGPVTIARALGRSSPTAAKSSSSPGGSGPSRRSETWTLGRRWRDRGVPPVRRRARRCPCPRARTTLRRHRLPRSAERRRDARGSPPPRRCATNSSTRLTGRRYRLPSCGSRRPAARVGRPNLPASGLSALAAVVEPVEPRSRPRERPELEAEALGRDAIRCWARSRAGRAAARAAGSRPGRPPCTRRRATRRAAASTPARGRRGAGPAPPIGPE